MKRRAFVVFALAGTACTSPLPGRLAVADITDRSLPFEKYSSDVEQAPFGSDVTPAIANYNRVSPYIANAGLLLKGGLEQAQRLGFKLIIDLRAADEKGVDEEQALAKKIGIKYNIIPVATRAPEWDQIDEFIKLIHQPTNYPVLVHCVSSNRSGAMWAMYRAQMGVRPSIAIEEGRAAGLESREQAVRIQLSTSTA